MTLYFYVYYNVLELLKCLRTSQMPTIYGRFKDISKVSMHLNSFKENERFQNHMKTSKTFMGFKTYERFQKN
jgi:hypothetical protein